MKTVNQKNRFYSWGAGPRGFTLIEVLVTMAILVVLLSLAAHWIAGAIRSAKVSQTQAAMGSALAMVNLLQQKSAIPPDHRLANMYWILPHANPPAAMVSASGARQMSSGEFFVFLATSSSATSTMVNSLGDYLRPSSVAFPYGPAASVALVDVYEQNPAVSNVQYKAKCQSSDGRGVFTAGAPTFVQVSQAAGYPLKSIYDAWGNEIVYRQMTYKGDLNGEDGTDVSSSTYTNRHDAEIIAQDEAVAQGTASPVLTGLVGLFPAMAGYAHPFFASPGPDGAWGAFIDPSVNPLRDATAEKRPARDLGAQDNLYSVEKNQ